MAGGPSTPALAASVSTAGGLGFLAAGYKSVEAVQRELEEIRSLLAESAPYGVNLFAPPGHGAGVAGVTAYAGRLREEADRRAVTLGLPRWDDDSYEAKLDLLCAGQVPVVSMTFGCPSSAEVDRLHDAGSAVWVTVTTVQEAQFAQRARVDGLIVQGVEAGGHRGGFDDTHPGDLGLLALFNWLKPRSKTRYRRAEHRTWHRGGAGGRRGRGPIGDCIPAAPRPAPAKPTAR